MRKEGVILLHGILRTKRSMQGIAAYLYKNHYEVLNINYPSCKLDIMGLANLIEPQVKDFCTKVTKVHFVGYSMGGLIIRTYLNSHRPINLGRIVMLGTPNQGSEIADFLQRFWIYKTLYGPSGQQLITDQTAFKNIFGSVDYDLGIIAGKSRFNFIGSKIIGNDSDGRVSIASTKIQGMKDHIVINAGHTMLAANRKVWQLTISFLNKGAFR
jgi:pimeloyl-ACP methyl ester carboxylesterase